MERQKLLFKVGDLVSVESPAYIGNGLIVGFSSFGYDGEPTFHVVRPVIPFSNLSACSDQIYQSKLTLIRHIDMPEMDVMAVDATAEMVSEEVHQGV
jgi:hypothetical protein